MAICTAKLVPKTLPKGKIHSTLSYIYMCIENVLTFQDGDSPKPLKPPCAWSLLGKKTWNTHSIFEVHGLIQTKRYKINLLNKYHNKKQLYTISFTCTGARQ